MKEKKVDPEKLLEEALSFLSIKLDESKKKRLLKEYRSNIKDGCSEREALKLILLHVTKGIDSLANEATNEAFAKLNNPRSLAKTSKTKPIGLAKLAKAESGFIQIAQPEEQEGEGEVIENDKEKNKILKGLVILGSLIIIALLVFIFYLFTTRNNNTPEDNNNKTNVTVSANETQRQRADQVLLEKGWTPGTYTLDIDTSLDVSTAGTGSYSDTPLYTPEEMVTFLQGKSEGALVIIEYLKGKTGNTEDDILNSMNWISVQSLVDFTYPLNTGLSSGKTFEAGTLAGHAGDIFLLYLPVVDQNASDIAAATAAANANAVAVRGACVNIQIVIPTLGTPDEYLEPKDPSEDVGANDAVADWKKDDTGGNAANGHTVSNADGSTVSNGYQADPTADAATAANNAAETNQELTDEHNAATDTATPVNTTQDKTVTTNPGW